MRIFRTQKPREVLGGYHFLLPNLLGLFVLTSFAVLATFLFAFNDWDIVSLPGRVAFQNIFSLIKQQLFWKYVGNTLYLLMGIPIAIFSSLWLVLVLKRKLEGSLLFKILYFAPTISTAVAIYLLWRWIYNPDLGLLSGLIESVGVHAPEWLSATNWTKPPLILIGLWAGIGGYSMVLYLSGLQTIDRALYEAGEIDGASKWQKFWIVTWPMLTPMTSLIFAVALIAGLQGGFQAVYVMTHGGSASASATISYYLYNNAYEWFKMGYASSITWFLCVLILVVSLSNWKYKKT